MNISKNIFYVKIDLTLPAPGIFVWSCPGGGAYSVPPSRLRKF